MIDKEFEGKTAAPLGNVKLAVRSMEVAMNRPQHLPGFVGLYGFAGFGKTTAAVYCANKYNAYYISVKSVWTRKYLLGAILKEMGIVVENTIPEMLAQVAEQLALSRRPLIIDEADYLVDVRQRHGMWELIRDIFESSFAAIMVVGEDRFPEKVKQISERGHRRFVEWARVQPISLADVRALCALYAPDVAFDDDILVHIHRLAKGSAGRVTVNIERVRQLASDIGAKKISLSQWGKREFYTGEAPARITAGEAPERVK